MDNAVKDYRDKLLELEQNRRVWDTKWKEVSEYLLYRRGVFNLHANTQDTVTRTLKSLDIRPKLYLQRLAALMQGGLTSPARKWFRLDFVDPGYRDWKPGKDWLDQTSRILYATFNESNYYPTTHQTYMELGGFGTGSFFMDEDRELVFRTAPLTIGTYWIATDRHGRVDTLYRVVGCTPRQVAQWFGEKVMSQTLKRLLDSKPNTPVKIIHAVEPREEWDPRKTDNLNMPFRSIYFEWGGDYQKLSEGGFIDFPYIVPRWDVTGLEPWGDSPGQDALSDIKQLTGVKRDMIAAIHKELNPPMAVPPNYKDRLSLLPGAQNRDTLTSGEGIRPLYQIKPNTQSTMALAQDIMGAIKEAFFNDLFIFLMEGGVRTATEIAERQEEKLLLMGPVIERQETEQFKPAITRVYTILERQGKIPPPPKELTGQPLKIEFVGLLAQAQKMVGLQAVDRVVGSAANLAQVKPEVLDKIDFDQVIDVQAEMVGCPQSIIVADDQVAALRQQRTQLQQQAQQQQNAMGVAEVAHKLGNTPMGENRNALQTMMENLSG